MVPVGRQKYFEQSVAVAESAADAFAAFEQAPVSVVVAGWPVVGRAAAEQTVETAMTVAVAVVVVVVD